MLNYYPITPMAKPRMTKADAITMRRLSARQRLTPKQQKRAAVLGRWMAFKDEVKLRNVQIPDENAQIIYLLPMPKTWTQRKRDEMRGYPHRGKKDKARKNDVDNLLKAILDAVFGDDSGVWDIRPTKIWWDTGGIFILENEAIYITIPFDRALWLERAGFVADIVKTSYPAKSSAASVLWASRKLYRHHIQTLIRQIRLNPSTTLRATLPNSTGALALGRLPCQSSIVQ